jgi:4-amino-4-deoxy-L-arabinose transferase-like glycosyltransferase
LALNLALSYENPEWGFVDEYFYIPAAIGMLHGQTCTIPNLIQTTVCNYEHPPLAKVLTAISIYLFTWRVPPGPLFGSMIAPGPLPTPTWFIAWRFFPLVMGALSVPLLYAIANRISQNRRTALLAAALLALEPVYLFFSRTAYLDIPMIFFALCGFAAYFSWTRSSRYWAAGVFMACSALSKETGVVFVVPLVIYHLMFGEVSRGARSKAVLMIVGGTCAVFAVGLQLYDTFGMTPFPTFLNQLTYMLEYAKAIAQAPSGLGPLAWVTFYLPTSSSIYHGLVISLPLTWMVYLWVPLGIYALVRFRGRASPETRLLVFATLLFLATFLENLTIFEAGRITYIWYYLTCVPGLALGAASLLTRPKVPTLATIVVVLFVAAWFVWALFNASPIYSI